MIAALLALVAAAVALPAAEIDRADKWFVTTSWWPAGTERVAESVGIVSRGMLWASGMMETNATDVAEAAMELSDVNDIAHAANISASTTSNTSALREGLVSCLVNARPSHLASVRAAWRAQLGDGVALSVVEMSGEYAWANSCVAVQPGGPPKVVRAAADGANGATATVVVGGALPRRLAHVAAEGPSAADVLGVASQALVESGSTLADLLECTAFAQNDSTAASVRTALAAQAPVPPALTLLSGQFGIPLVLRCVASANTNSTKEAVRNVPGAYAVRSAPASPLAGPGLVMASALEARHANATDAMDTLAAVLAAAGSRMRLVLNCQFFVPSLAGIKPLFAGFFDRFNVKAYPPPSRTEFVAAAPRDGRTRDIFRTQAVRL